MLLVLFGHLIESRYSDLLSTGTISTREMLHSGFVDVMIFMGKELLNRAALPFSLIGVHIFFCISGFIITYLLIAEERKYGVISLSGFFRRRVLRIFPAFFAFIGLLWLGRFFGWVTFDDESLVSSTLFACNIGSPHCGWNLGHTWSLAIEQQYYLIWPFLFVFFKQHRAMIVVAAVVMGVALYLLFPASVQNTGYSFTFIAAGAFVAISEKAQHFIKSLHHSIPPLITVAVLSGSIVAPALHLNWLLDLFMPILLSLVIFKPVFCKNRMQAFLDAKAISYVGLVSYSLYLWQQPFTGSAASHLQNSLFDYPLLMIIPALFSFYFVERPFIAIGKNWGTRWPRTTSNAAVVEQ